MSEIMEPAPLQPYLPAFIFTGGTKTPRVNSEDDIKVTFIESGRVPYFLATWVLSNNDSPPQSGT